MSFTRTARYSLSVGSLALLAAACLDTPTDFTCEAVTNQQASVSGDSVITTTGLKYRELTVGTGAAVETTDDCQFVRVRYVGRLQDGTVFSQTPEGVTFDFTVGAHQVISGFEQGTVGMLVGGSRQLIIPPALGYGSEDLRDSSGRLVVPGNSTLTFDITLVSVQAE